MLEILQYEFMRNALLAGLLAAIACGVVGTYVVTKRIVFISGGIAHASFGGVGLGYLVGFNPVIGALLFAVASAFGMGWIMRRTGLPADTTIGMLWAVGMALGVMFIGLSPGYAPDLFSYLFGSILGVPSSDLLLMAVLDAVILTAVVLFYKELLAISFDEEYSTVTGVPVEIFYMLFLMMVALTVTLLIRVVGIILVIALLTIPAALARRFTCDMRSMMLLAVLFGAVFTLGGMMLSYFFDVASGAAIILLSGAAMLVTLLLEGVRKRSRRMQAVSEIGD